MRKIKRIFCLFIAVLMLLTGCSQPNHLLQDNMISFLDDHYNEEDTTVKLSDFTNFEWDNLLIFKYPVSAQDIENAVGVKYEGSLDLTSGMIFVADGRIVYEEIFENDYTHLSALLIYPYDDINAPSNYNVFTPETAVFTCDKVTAKGESGYRLYPMNNDKLK